MQSTTSPVSPQAPPTQTDSKGAMLTIAAISVVALVAVPFVMFVLPSDQASSQPTFLASVDAALNGLAALCLLAGYAFIRRGKERAHRTAMLSAFGASCAFLVAYLVHHAQVGSVPFLGQGLIRTLYFSLLIPHIILAAGVVPLALLSIYRGWTNRRQLHRRIARITLPVWLFVSVSGVVLYFMLYHLPV